MELLRSMRRRRLLVLSVLTVLLAVLTAIALMVQRGNSASVRSSQGSHPPLPRRAEDAYGMIRPWMESWAEDSEVVAMSLSMRKGGAERAPWSFLVYSGQKKRVAVVAVVESELMILRERHTAYPQAAIDPELWVLDSATILDRWWQHGGDAIWDKTTARSLHLRLSMEADRLIWRISVLDSEGKPIGFWRIRADSGEILSD